MKVSPKAKRRTIAVPAASKASAPTELLADVRELIESARHQVAQTVNAGLVTLYWLVGKRIREEILGEQRAAYGEEIVHALSAQLTAEYGRGFTRTNLFYMIQFAEAFPDKQIVHALRGQLTWTHFRELLTIKDPEEAARRDSLGAGTPCATGASNRGFAAAWRAGFDAPQENERRLKF
jgi:hypothetical protein